MQSSYPLPDDEPGKTYIPCRQCGSRSFYWQVIGSDDAGRTMEEEQKCSNCHMVRLYWSYGSVDGCETFEEEEKMKLFFDNIEKEMIEAEKEIFFSENKAALIKKTHLYLAKDEEGNFFDKDFISSPKKELELFLHEKFKDLGFYTIEEETIFLELLKKCKEKEESFKRIKDIDIAPYSEILLSF